MVNGNTHRGAISLQNTKHVFFFSDIVEFLQTDSGVEQMDSPLMFERTINAVQPQSELYRVAREVPGDKGEVLHNVSCHN